MPKFYFEKLIDSQREKVFKVFTNFSEYQKLIPQYFPSVRILSSRNEVSVIEEHLMLGDRELVMMTKHVVEEPKRHETFVIGGDAKGTHIVERFEPISSGTKLLVFADFKLKGGMKISSLLGRNKVENDYSKIMDEFVKIAET